jgi:putative transposase
MARPPRNAQPKQLARTTRTFFATTRTHSGRRLLQSERNAELLIEVLRSCVAEHKFKLLDFVIMPDHIHLLMALQDQMSIEKAMQLIKGRFSYLLKKDYGYLGDVWQHGFSEVRADDSGSRQKYREYIAQNPVKAGLCGSSEEYPFCFFSGKEKGR